METKIESPKPVSKQNDRSNADSHASNLPTADRVRKSSHPCANEYCTSDPENLAVKQISFNGQTGYYCDYCRGAINRKWVCPFCYMIFNENAVYPDKCVWICCDTDTCGCWSHLSCESQFGNPNISNLLKNPNYKYMCLSCRNNKSKNKNTMVDNAKKTDGKKAEKPLTVEEVRKLMITKRKPQQYNYTYLYSENYQTIEKLLSSCNCGFSLQLNDEQIDEDMRIFNEIVEKGESGGKENQDSKNDGTENLEKRSYKRFNQRGIRN